MATPFNVHFSRPYGLLFYITCFLHNVFLLVLTCFAKFCFQKLKATLSQQLPQVTNGDGGEIQSSAVTHTAAPASPVPTPTPTPAPTAILTPAPHLPTTEAPSPHSLQQPATSTTETPVSTYIFTVYCFINISYKKLLLCVLNLQLYLNVD